MLVCFLKVTFLTLVFCSVSCCVALVPRILGSENDDFVVQMTSPLTDWPKTKIECLAQLPKLINTNGNQPKFEKFSLVAFNDSSKTCIPGRLKGMLMDINGMNLDGDLKGGVFSYYIPKSKCE